MRETLPFYSLTASGLTAFALVAAIFISGDGALAHDGAPAAAASPLPPTCGCPGAANQRQKPKFADLRAVPDDGRPLDSGDEVAALSSVQYALSSTADGATYVWHRNNGRLSGLVQPTSSFKSADGAICRHVVLMLTTGDKTRKAEGVACRSTNGVWSLEG